MNPMSNTWWKTDVKCPKCGDAFLNWSGALVSYCEACDTKFENDPYEMVKHLDTDDRDSRSK